MLDKEIKYSIDCTCGDASHRIVVQEIGKGETMQLMLTMSNGESSIWKRIVTAWKILVYGFDNVADIFISCKDAKDFSNWLFYRTTQASNAEDDDE